MRFLRSFLLCMVCFFGFAFSQNNQIPTPLAQSTVQTTDSWFGLTTGFINTSYPFGLALHFGVVNQTGPDIRISGSFQVRNGGTSLGVGADVLTPFAEVLPLKVYGGGGALIMFEEGSFLLDGHGLFGFEYSFSEYDLEEIGLFLELRLGAALAVGGSIPQPSVPSAGVVLGINIYF